MAKSRADSIWSAMRAGEYYSIRDLANVCEQSSSSVAAVMRFLSKYGFVQSYAKSEVFTKAKFQISPDESVGLLETLLAPLQK